MGKQKGKPKPHGGAGDSVFKVSGAKVNKAKHKATKPTVSAKKLNQKTRSGTEAADGMFADIRSSLVTKHTQEDSQQNTPMAAEADSFQESSSGKPGQTGSSSHSPPAKQNQVEAPNMDEATDLMAAL